MISQKLKENIQTAVKQIKTNKIETSYIQSIGSFLFLFRGDNKT